MMVEIENPGRPLEESEIAAFEREFHLTLPADYRAFLLTYNGGRPTPDSVDIEGLPYGGGTDVHALFGLDRPIESNTLRWNFELFEGNLPEPNLLPIGNDSYGNLFFLRVSGPNEGQIIFGDSVESVLHEYFVASSFSEFLAKLKVWVDPNEASP